MRRLVLSLRVEYDEDVTSADAVTIAIDDLLDRALCTTNTLDEVGNPRVGHLYIQPPWQHVSDD